MSCQSYLLTFLFTTLCVVGVEVVVRSVKTESIYSVGYSFTGKLGYLLEGLVGFPRVGGKRLQRPRQEVLILELPGR